MKKHFALLLTAGLLLSCQNNNPGSQAMGEGIGIAEKSSEPIDVVKKFLAWYGANMDHLQDNTIDFAREGNYSVNADGVESYLSKLEKTHFFTADFLEKERQTFVDADNYFKENPQTDGPPDGFESDRFFFTQESFEDDLKNAERIKYSVNQTGQDSEVRFYLPSTGITYAYTLKMVGSEWRIDTIKPL